MRITLANSKAVSYACTHFHYAKAVPVNTIGYNIYNKAEEWCGVVLFGTGATPNIGKPYNLPMGGVLELVRVALNGKQEATSQAEAMALKQLHKDAPICRLVVSYADCDQHHLGTIYQATNWIYVGTHNKGQRGAFIVHGKKMHPKSVYAHYVTIDGKRQHCPQTLEAVRKYLDPKATEFITQGKRLYLMPMDKAMKRQIAPLAKPYPKNDENWTKIDRKQFDKEIINEGEKRPQT